MSASPPDSAHLHRPAWRAAPGPARRATAVAVALAACAACAGARSARAGAPPSRPVEASAAPSSRPAEASAPAPVAAACACELPPNGPYGDSSGWAVGIDQGLKGDGIEAGAHALAPLGQYWAVHARVYLLLEGQTQRPAGEAMVEAMLRSAVIHRIVRFYGTLGVNVPFLANKLTSTTFVAPRPQNLFFIGGNSGFELFQDGDTSYFLEVGWWGGYQATRFTIQTAPGTHVALHPWVGNGPLVNAGVRWYFD